MTDIFLKHAGYTLPSVCTARHLQGYWVHGALPESGTKCEPDGREWDVPVRTWADTIEELAGKSNSTSRLRH